MKSLITFVLVKIFKNIVIKFIYKKYLQLSYNEINRLVTIFINESIFCKINYSLKLVFSLI